MTATTENKNNSTETQFKDAIALLKKDHRNVEDAFAKFDKMASGEHARKKKLADHICAELLVHMQVEEELFYPAVKENVKSAEGVVEHAGAKNLIKQIKAMKGDEELFDTKVKVLAEQD